MLDGLEHVLKAAEILAASDSLLRERLKKATGEFTVSLLQPEQWPDDLLPKAKELRDRLKDIDSLNDREAKKLAEDLLSLAIEVQIAYREDADHFWENRS